MVNWTSFDDRNTRGHSRLGNATKRLARSVFNTDLDGIVTFNAYDGFVVQKIYEKWNTWTGSMTDLAEGKRARNVETSNARGDTTFGERGNEAQSHRDQAGQNAY